MCVCVCVRVLSPSVPLVGAMLTATRPCSFPQEDEYYVCIYAERAGNVILFHHEGGVDIGDVDAKATKLALDIEDTLSADRVLKDLIAKVPADRQRSVAPFALQPCRTHAHTRTHTHTHTHTKEGGKREERSVARPRNGFFSLLLFASCVIVQSPPSAAFFFLPSSPPGAAGLCAAWRALRLCAARACAALPLRRRGREGQPCGDKRRRETSSRDPTATPAPLRPRPSPTPPLLCSIVSQFIVDLYATFQSLHFTYLEINPLGRLRPAVAQDQNRGLHKPPRSLSRPPPSLM